MDNGNNDGQLWVKKGIGGAVAEGSSKGNS
jgi:hypothetical protein